LLKSGCLLIESKSTPTKARKPDLVVLNAATASPSHDLARKRKKNYKLNCHFQDFWAAKLPWAKGVVGADGRITQVYCTICIDIEGREKLLVSKINSLYKHASRRRALEDMGKVRHGEQYYLGSNQYVKNERIYFAKDGQTIVQRVMHGVTKERKRKVLQIKSFFHVMSLGWPMVDFTAMQVLLLQVDVADIPKKHWGESSRWDFAQAMAKVCSDRLKASIAKSTFISMNVDEVTTLDNLQWLSIHVYYNMNSNCESHMLFVCRVDCEANASNLTNMIVE
jgi:hypothetical protein